MNGAVKRQRQRLLAINFGGIGDEILFLPTLEAMKQLDENCHITLLLEPRSQSIKQLTATIDQVLTFDIKKRPLLVSDLLDLLALLRAGNYHKVVSSGSSPLVCLLLFLSGIPERIGYDSGRLSHFLLTKPVKLNYEQYAANMYRDLVSPHSSNRDEALPSILLQNSSLYPMKQLASKKDRESTRIIVIHPGTSQLAVKKGIIKTWPAQSWTDLIERLLDHNDIEVILAGGPDDAEVISDISAALELRHLATKVVMAFGKTKSLADLAALISLSDLLVCVDSAPMHIGVGLGRPLVALFGATDQNKLLPKDNRFRSLSLKQKHARRPTKEELLSGVQLPPDIVYQAVMDQLQLSSSLKRPLESSL
jgi:ADP-heptose:LPS heptosyltransferase